MHTHMELLDSFRYLKFFVRRFGALRSMNCGDTAYEDYYNTQPWDKENDNDIEVSPYLKDPEYAVYECLKVEDVEILLNESVELLRAHLEITPSIAKLFLHLHEWALQDILLKYQDSKINFTCYSNFKLTDLIEQSCNIQCKIRNNICSVCCTTFPTDNFSTLNCGHAFCNNCWCTHFETQIRQGVSTVMICQQPVRHSKTL
ncbi:potential E3 ubiquitin-protein ligase ariadne-2-like [Copidosoma floridanum]|uniref:potential E3 ubiquitin-protein ligase ariadne-2-like n=1 Tax=Copidosoma floridanum TaxID=29053 RepID=UPI0006C94872|nr:potential E3 ubiquitin-protein ligase ariadne-2-like [Copidosoma floridanum]